MSRIVTTLAILLLATLPTFAFASGDSRAEGAVAEQEVTAARDSAEDIPTLKQVTVVGQAEGPFTGQSNLSQEHIRHLPQKNGSLNEQLSILPGVQLSDGDRTSENAGEILPPNISISGGKFYENDFRIDGIGNNSFLDPAFDVQDNRDNIPGHPQQLFLDPSFVENVTVYRSNIPARYSGFTGGVVDAQTRNPSNKLGGHLSYRMTKDSWTEFHVAPEKKDEFESSNTADQQPRFKKYKSEASIDLPITENVGLLLGYSKTHSKIPLLLLNDWKDQKRKQENYFAKLIWEARPDTTLILTGIATPYEADRFHSDTIHSDYTYKGSGYGVTASLDQTTKLGLLELDINWRHNRNEREAPENWFNWRTTPSKDWGSLIDESFSKEGSYGDIDKSEEVLEVGTHLTTVPLYTGEISHTLATGATFQEAHATFDRSEEMTTYSGSWLSSEVSCLPGEIDCVDNEQFMFFKNVYPKDSADVRVRFLDIYGEDQIEWEAFTFRPGIHVSHNDLNNNTDWSPRLSMSWDLFRNGRTILLAGANRYHSKTLLTHALAEEKTPYEVWRRGNDPLDRFFFLLDPDNHPKPWQNIGRSSINLTRFADLDTPYSDELTAGISQDLLGGRLELLYIKRENKDELALSTLDINESNIAITEWNNNGSTDHEEVSLSWERQWHKHYINFNVTWQETKTSHHDYTVTFEDEMLIKPIWLPGQGVIDRSNLPRTDFNREWIGNLTWIAHFPHGVTFTNTTKYRSSYRAMGDTGENIDSEQHGTLDVYEEITNPASWHFNWVLEWEKRIYKQQKLALRAEIDNVFDKKVPSGPTIDVYDLGRQFWLGMTYKF